MIDPDTGERLGANEEFVGTVKKSRATAKMSYADIIENGSGMQIGMFLQPKVAEKTDLASLKVPW